ncbi:TPA: protein rep [Staphylococcus aureus]|nr:protein rep [Staphylococcus aureus]HDK3420606.1 protein rep [Staphylococcus aureus]HDK3423320.1 protein rep [Staphylococcus aureus]HDK3592038.1 protein rep [Staphylococcus aureus]HDK3646951.1 protein rep [Staphylococcus aureus]
MEKYTQKKLRNQLLQTLIGKHVSDKSFERIKECNTFLFMVADKTMEKTKLHRSNNCENRFCPICAWKKSRKNALKISVLMQYLREEENKDFVFLTLTAPNVKGEELDDEIKHYNQSFQRLMQRKEVKNAVRGYVRKLEVTYNKERDDYHPHFHVILVVDKQYFNNKKQYIKRDRWLELWQKSTKNNLITQVDVRKVKATDNKKEVSEIAKYSAKDSDYLEDEKVFDTFYKSLSGKRLIVYSGLFKDASKLYENKELEKYKELDPTQYIYQIFYHWGRQDYVQTEKKLMTDEMQKEVNNKMLDEDDFEDE